MVAHYTDQYVNTIMVVLTPSIAIIQRAVQAGSFVYNWQQIGKPFSLC